MNLPDSHNHSMTNQYCKGVCNPDFEFLENCFLDFSEWFSGNGQVFHSDRNVLKRFESSLLDGLKVDLVAKSFKIPNPISRIVYSFFRQSKAKRSFENSTKLLAAGFSVPVPVAYIEYFEKNLLKESFYISEYLKFDCTLHEVYRKQMFDRQTIIPLVVEQAYRMHQMGFLHRDFSHGNVLVKKEKEGFSFSFVDLNRLYEGGVSFEQGLKSLVRLAKDKESLELLSNSYAACAQRDKTEALAILSKYLVKHQNQKELKQKFKDAFGFNKPK